MIGIFMKKIKYKNIQRIDWLTYLMDAMMMMMITIKRKTKIRKKIYYYHYSDASLSVGIIK